MKAEKFLKLSLITLISFLFVSYTFSQAGRGKARIAGVVLDEEGNPIKSAKIVIEFLESSSVKQETTTNKKGEWAFLGLGTGMLRVTASADGYIPTYVEIYVRQLLQKNPKITLTLKKIEESDNTIMKDEASFNLFEEANLLFADKKYDEALALLEQFLEQNPIVYQAHLSIGDCYREKGELDKAIEEYNRALEKAQKDKEMGKETVAKALAALGEIYLRKDDFEKAQNYFKQSIETYPENEILAYNVGEIYFSNQKIDEAIHYFELSTQIRPDYSPSYLKLGYVYLNKGNYEKAKLNFNKFLELDPESSEAPAVKNIVDYLEKTKK
jgi:tetratricopeptide (TPR) repeat protein